ncbi:unnamed protein product [Arctia plantaginis]|uniref:Uncharacterized protein n=1 Tax=Arctia plantaginis TaxID=874455 RepID=A0A8S0ZSE8_ARCPL|nr:unnamed protein product [Arctia plantaginis]
MPAAAAHLQTLLRTGESPCVGPLLVDWSSLSTVTLNYGSCNVDALLCDDDRPRPLAHPFIFQILFLSESLTDKC